jgi:benzoyl-CoA 2,3-dioxygenase component B
MGSPTRLALPNRRFHRHQGVYAGFRFDPAGEAISEETWRAHKGEWLPNDHDRAHLQAIMQPVIEPGKFANWIAPPRRGLNAQPLAFEYVRG